jgi:hypothetical protein
MEVADILRAQGDRFLERYQSSFSNQQLKAFRAISRCRTAALGGHIDVCHHCGYEAGMSYKWIVYAKPPFGEPAQLLRYRALHASHRHFQSPPAGFDGERVTSDNCDFCRK